MKKFILLITIINQLFSTLIIIGSPEVTTYTIENCETHINDIIQIKHPGVEGDNGIEGDWFSVPTQLGEYGTNFNAPDVNVPGTLQFQLISYNCGTLSTDYTTQSENYLSNGYLETPVDNLQFIYTPLVLGSTQLVSGTYSLTDSNNSISNNDIIYWEYIGYNGTIISDSISGIPNYVGEQVNINNGNYVIEFNTDDYGGSLSVSLNSYNYNTIFTEYTQSIDFNTTDDEGTNTFREGNFGGLFPNIVVVDFQFIISTIICDDELACNYGLEQECTYSSTGDINLDCEMNVVDVVNMVEMVLQDTPPTEQQIIMGDMNQDGMVNVVDIVMLVSMIIGVLFK